MIFLIRFSLDKCHNSSFSKSERELSVGLLVLFSLDIMSLFTSNIISGNLIKFLIVLSIFIYIIIIFIIKLICEKELERGVNII